MALATCLLLTLWPTTRAHPYTDTAPCQGEAHHLSKGKAIVNDAFTAPRWRDKTPMREHEVRHYRHHKFCLSSKRDELVAHRHDAARHHRKARSRRLFRARYTPYRFGEPTIQWVAIPPEIVQCETNGYSGASRWRAANPSGAIGPYQLLGKGAPWPVDSVSDRRTHHRIAADLYAGGAGRSHWAC